MLQCSLFVEKHCSNSNLKHRDEEAVGVGFWGVFTLKLALKKPLEMLLRGIRFLSPKASNSFKFCSPIYDM